MIASSLARVLEGWLLEWEWKSGLGPEVIADAIDKPVTPGRIRYSGRERLGARMSLPCSPWPVWFIWEATRELALIEVTEPALQPSVEEVKEALGPPEKTLPFGVGPHPGAEQQVYLSRGVTLFDSANRGISYAWLFKPTSDAEYEQGLGAREKVVRPAPDFGRPASRPLSSDPKRLRR